jgi:hypothetical protein
MGNGSRLNVLQCRREFHQMSRMTLTLQEALADFSQSQANVSCVVASTRDRSHHPLRSSPTFRRPSTGQQQRRAQGVDVYV